jgi:hypothetical protein
MKKFLAVALLSLASVANAGSFIVEYSPTQGIGRPDGTGYLVKVGESISKNVELDFQAVTAQSDGTLAVSTRLEAGLTPKFNVGFGTFYTKFGLGRKLDARGNKDYYGIEPGIIVPFANRWNVRYGYRFRDGYGGDTGERTDTHRLGVGYELTKTDAINVRFDRQRGDSNQNSWNFAYIRRF